MAERDESSEPDRSPAGPVDPHPPTETRTESAERYTPQANSPAENGSENTGGPAGTPATTDEEFRQYQQFLRFQEWQRQHGDVELVPRKRRSRWRRVLGALRFKFVRRLVLLGVVLLLAATAINYYFPDSDDGSTGGNGSADITNPAAGRRALPMSPKDTIYSLYNMVGAGSGTGACLLFTDAAAQTFAMNHDAANCQQAVTRLRQQVNSSVDYPNVGFDPTALTIAGEQAQVRSCALNVRGGPRLGAFALQRQPNGGWIISGHEKEPACG